MGLKVGLVEVREKGHSTIKEPRISKFVISNLLTYNKISVDKLMNRNFCEKTAKGLFNYFTQLPQSITHRFNIIYLQYLQRLKPELKITFDLNGVNHE